MKVFGIVLMFGCMWSVQGALNWVPEGASQECGIIDKDVLKDWGKDVRGLTPWQVCIFRQLKTESKPQYVCSGSIIGPNLVLTAAQCFRDVEDSTYTAVVGHYNATLPFAQDETIQQFPIKPKNTFIHQNYNPDQYNNDIALFKVDTPIRFTKYIKPVCLPAKNLVYRSGLMCEVAGFGLNPKGPNSNIIKIANIPLIDDEECKQKYAPHSKDLQNTSGMHCSGAQCLDNAGSPVVCKVTENNKSYWIQYGFTTYGNIARCDELPTVNTKITQYMEWIDKHVKLAAKQ